MILTFARGVTSALGCVLPPSGLALPCGLVPSSGSLLPIALAPSSGLMLPFGLTMTSAFGVALPPGLGLALLSTLGLLPWLALGVAVGVVHFALLRRNASLYLTTGGLGRALALQIVRMSATTLLLGFAAWHGALPLLVTTIGVFLARAVVLRGAGTAP